MTAPSRSIRLAAAVYRLAVRLLPRDFRDRYGAELVECFESIAGDARRQGRLAVLGVTMRSLFDLVGRGSRQRIQVAGAGFTAPGGWWKGTWQDLRIAARGLRRRPSFSLVTVVTLALGIAAATSVFSLFYGVVLSPLPYPESDRVMQVDHGGRQLGTDRGLGITVGFYRFYADQVRTAEALAMYSPAEPTLTGVGEPVQLQAARATPSLAEVLRVPPRLGRWFLDGEEKPGAAAVAVLSDQLWRERFNADPSVLGRTIQLDGTAFEVVGVMPPGFAFPDERTRLWMPRSVPRDWIGGWGEQAIARLRPGVTPADLERELASLFPRLRDDPVDPARVASYLDDAGIFPRVVPLKDEMVGEVRATLWVLFGTVIFVLLIAVANIANLFLVRAEETQREIAVRRALGAARGRLVRATLAETFLVAGAAGALGLAAATGVVGLLRRYAPITIPRLAEVHLDGTVIGAALGVTLLVAIFLGVIPMLRPGHDPGETLREGNRRSTATRTRLQGRSILVAAQVALALMLLIGSGLLLRTFAALRAVDPGFIERQALVFDLGLPPSRYRSRAEVQAFHQRLEARLAALPGVRMVGAVGNCLPLTGAMCHGDVLQVEGRPTPPGTVPPVTGVRVVGTDYFRTLGVDLEGRAFTAGDATGAGSVAILSRAAARAYFSDQDALGQRVRLGTDYPWLTVVGVAGDLKVRMATDEFTRLIYLPVLPAANYGPWPGVMSYVLATSIPPTGLVPSVREVLDQLDPALPLANLGTLQGLIDDATAPAGFALVLVGVAAGIALLLGAVGVYGVIAYAVSRRTAEIGVRLALGAGVADVRWMVVRQGGVVVLTGIGFGLAGAFALTRTLRTMLFGVSPTDPVSYAGLTLVMILVALLALYLPARRASRVDPIEALRAE